jgi:hypothetical protein
MKDFWKWFWLNAYDLVPVITGILIFWLIGAGVIIDHMG